MQKYFSAILLILSVIFVVPSCSGSANKDEKKQEQTKETYQCPMKCEGLKYDKPGKCSVCGMELEKVDPS